MKVRILTGVGGCTAAILLLLFAPAWMVTVVVAAFSAMAMWEVLVVTRLTQHLGQAAASLVFAALAPFFMLERSGLLALTVSGLYVALMGLFQVLAHDKMPVRQTGFVFMMSVLIALAFSCLAYTRVLEVDAHGVFYVFLVLGITWICDIGAYFVGTFFGRHKLCPGISPKKTVEGLVGGVICAMVGAVIATGIYQGYLNILTFEAHVSLLLVLLLALVGAPLSVLGDLFASVVKRQCEVKDFGSLLPGHGGVMDRFDSLLFAAPMLYLLLRALPVIV